MSQGFIVLKRLHNYGHMLRNRQTFDAHTLKER